MRSYMELIYFLRDLGDGIQDHLPEELRTGQLPLNVIVDQWVDKKTYFAIRSLEKDILSYIEKYKVGDFSVDQILFDFDLLFIPERFGCEEPELLGEVLLMLKARVVDRKRSVLKDLAAWLRSKLGV
ncbi:hypothetical protein [Pseudomonas sp. LS-2]|uniref:hypothetical protein n=1 Tax=Pseudomonas sp. LS-2 TaxID=2315859 RepID=UPI000E728496|nr:hypothetical protein [Pseudomonas sp. LS-2]RJX81515.1 hypothetical protein D3M70_10345 [Pseudomonas sp. LS-2]